MSSDDTKKNTKMQGMQHKPATESFFSEEPVTYTIKNNTGSEVDITRMHASVAAVRINGDENSNIDLAFDEVKWDFERLEENTVSLRRISQATAEESGSSLSLDTTVTYSLNDDGKLSVTYDAKPLNGIPLIEPSEQEQPDNIPTTQIKTYESQQYQKIFDLTDLPQNQR